jgi:hypothetical protein
MQGVRSGGICGNVFLYVDVHAWFDRSTRARGFDSHFFFPGRGSKFGLFVGAAVINTIKHVGGDRSSERVVHVYGTLRGEGDHAAN